MPSPREPERASDLVMLGFAAAALTFGTQIRELWAQDDAPWWAPFVPWVATLLVAGLVTRAWIHHGE